MDEYISDPTEEKFPQSLKRRYAYLSAWLLRLNRLPGAFQAGRTNAPKTAPRITVPPRQPHPPRPK
jgi:hypothetical protein